MQLLFYFLRRKRSFKETAKRVTPSSFSLILLTRIDSVAASRRTCSMLTVGAWRIWTFQSTPLRPSKTNYSKVSQQDFAALADADSGKLDAGADVCDFNYLGNSFLNMMMSPRSMIVSCCCFLSDCTATVCGCGLRNVCFLLTLSPRATVIWKQKKTKESYPLNSPIAPFWKRRRKIILLRPAVRRQSRKFSLHGTLKTKNLMQGEKYAVRPSGNQVAQSLAGWGKKNNQWVWSKVEWIQSKRHTRSKEVNSSVHRVGKVQSSTLHRPMFNLASSKFSSLQKHQFKVQFKAHHKFSPTRWNEFKKDSGTQGGAQKCCFFFFQSFFFRCWTSDSGGQNYVQNSTRTGSKFKSNQQLNLIRLNSKFQSNQPCNTAKKKCLRIFGQRYRALV